MRGRWLAMSRRLLCRNLVVGVAGSVAMSLVPSVAQATEPPPRFYENFTELTTTKRPVVADGRITLYNSVFSVSGEIHCLVTLYADIWNEHEHGLQTNPIRAYGEVAGWSPSSCESPHETLELERMYERKITFVVLPEMPLEREHRQAVVCKQATETKLAECPSGEEREAKEAIVGVRRGASSLPWKFELVRGEREAEPAILWKTGIHEFGESGTATNKSTGCYPKERVVVEGKEVERAASFTKVPSGCIAVDVIVPEIPLEMVFYGTQEILALNGFGNGLNASRLMFVSSGHLFSSEGTEGEAEETGLLTLFGADSVELLTAR